MATGGAVSDLNRFGGAVDKVSAQAIRDLERIGTATKQIGDMSPAIASVQKLADATARSSVSVARERLQAEKAGEAMVRQLERENATYGKSREQIRATRTEEAALAAERAGHTELAARLRAEMNLLAELRARAAAAADAEAQATREAAFAHGQFEAAARRGLEAMREQAAAAKAAAAAEADLARETAQLRAALDPMFAAQQRFDAELERADRLLKAGTISQREHNQAVQMSRDTLRDHAQVVAGSGPTADRLTQQQRASTAAMNANRTAMQGVSYQAQDTFTQLSMNANVFSVLAIQGGQLAGQFANMEGKAGSFARFLMGPWGLAFTAALLVVGALTKDMNLFGDAVDDATDKLKKDAAETETARRAKERFATSEAGVAAAIRDSTAASKEAIDATRTAGERANIAAKTNYERILSQRLLTRALYETALAEQAGTASAAGQMIAGEAGGVANSIMAKNAETLRARLAEQDQLVREAEVGVQQSRVTLAFETAEKIATAQGRVTKVYDDQLAVLQRTTREQVAAGRVVDGNLTRQIAALRVQRQAAIDAQQAEGRLKRDGETLTASAVAKMLRTDLDARITSTTGGKHVAGSYHYRPGGQAVDFVPAGGMGSMSKAQVRQWAEGRGLEIKELLGPGDPGHDNHFHLAFAKGKLAADAYTHAARQAADATREAERAAVDALRALDASDKLLGISPDQLAGRFTTAKPFGDQPSLTADRDFKVGMDNMAQAEAARAREAAQQELNDSLRLTSDLASSAGDAMANAFGRAGESIGEAMNVLGRYGEEQARIAQAVEAGQMSQSEGAARTAQLQISSFAGIAGAAKGFFKERSVGYRAMEAAEKALAALQLALALKNMAVQVGLIGTHVGVKVAGDAAMAASDTARAGVEQSNSIITTGVKAVEAVVNAIKSLPFPLNIAAGAATAAAIAALGVSIVGGFGGGKNTLLKANEGTGTVLGDADAKSESIKRAIDTLREVDVLMLSASRDMAASLRSIDSQIGGVAAVLVRSGDISADSRIKTGFKPNFLGSVLGNIPLIGGFLSGLFGSKTDVIASGLYGGPQSLGSILNGGYAAKTYSDTKKTSKFLGITTGTSYKTQYGAADPELGGQFTMLLRSFNDAIVAAAGPLGVATSDIEARLSGFVFNLGKIDLKGLSGAEIQAKLEAVFGAAGDTMASAAFPGVERWQKVGEGAFETLIRVASTVEAVTASLDQLGAGARAMSIDAKLAIADQFDNVGALTSAVDAYFQAFYTPAEQNAARLAQFGTVFTSLGLGLPDTLAGYRQLVEAQDLTTAAGQSTYATLLQLAPAFAELQSALQGTKSAADLASERQDLERRLLELRGDTAAIRALDLAKLDASNRGLQQQIWAMQDGQEAARQADELRKAWTSVGDSLAAEVRRIRGLTAVGTGGSFAALQGQFNAANAAARAGDQDAAKSLPGLSQAMLTAAALVATSRQELDRVQAQTAASLEETLALIAGLGETPTASTNAQLLAAAASAMPAATTAAANDDLITEVQALRAEIAGMRSENNAGHAATSSAAGRVARKLDDVSAASGGDAISVQAA